MLLLSIVLIGVSSFFIGGQYFCDEGGGTVLTGRGCVEMHKVEYYECDGVMLEKTMPFINLTRNT